MRKSPVNAHFGKAEVLLLATAFVLAIGISFALIGRKRGAAASVADSARRIEEEAARAHPALAAPPVPLVDYVGSWDLPARAAAADDWIASARPRLHGNRHLVPASPLRPVSACRIESIEARQEGVTLRWAVTGPKDALPVARLRIERRLGETTDSFDVAGATWTDDTARPATRYEYRVVAECGEGRGASSDWSEVTTPDAWRLAFRNADHDRGIVQVRIDKYERPHGWLSATVIVRAGERIGSAQEMRINGRLRRIDFATGLELQSVDRVGRSRIRCSCERTARGCRIVRQTVNFTTLEIRTRDRGGSIRVWRDPDPVWTRDALCLLHHAVNLMQGTAGWARLAW